MAMSLGGRFREGVAPVASFVIPTRGRVEELRALIGSVLAQTVPVEILVMDDGDSSVVGEILRIEFPEVQYHSLASGRGPAFQRNRGIELATCDVVFAVDDDTVFVSPLTVEQTLAEFERSCVGAVGIPFVNVRIGDAVHQRAPEQHGIWVAHAFVGAAHAVRRSVFLHLGGYREHFFYMGEEGDLCLRMLNAGYIVRLGKAEPIHHLESSKRSVPLADYCGRRNDMLFVWHNVPWRWLPIHLAATTFNGVLRGLRSHHPAKMFLGILHGYLAIPRYWRERRPVSRSIYRMHRRLKKEGACALGTLMPELPHSAPGTPQSS